MQNEELPYFTPTLSLPLGAGRRERIQSERSESSTPLTLASGCYTRAPGGSDYRDGWIAWTGAIRETVQRARV